VSAFRISPQEAHAKMSEGYVYVDLRSEEEFAHGHPAGAVNVPFVALGGEFLQLVVGAFGKDARLVLGCKSGHTSLRAAHLLLDAGFANVLEQRAGWDGVRDAFGSVKEPGWFRAGLPVERGLPDGRRLQDVRARAAGRDRSSGSHG
jgi:rhodanese-related sulfurtransferase